MKIEHIKEIKSFKYLKSYEIGYKTKSGKSAVWEIASRGSLNRLEAEIINHKKFSDGAMIFATNIEKTKVVILKEYRVSAGRAIYMLPAGLSNENECIEAVAVREFKEETGLKFTPVTASESRYVSVGIINECVSVVYGYFEGIPSNTSQEDNEEAEIMIVDKDEVIRILKEEDVAFRSATLLESFFNLNPFC